jgi:hypothetical protein
MTATGSAAGSEMRAEEPATASLERLGELDLAGWQSLLDRHAEMFSGMAPGSRIALMAADDFDEPAAAMLVWEATAQGMRVDYRPFPGFPAVEVDLLFLADDDTLRHLHDGANPAPFREMKTKVRRREILLYIVHPRDELIERGYEDFLDSLGLVFMGACR